MGHQIQPPLQHNAQLNYLSVLTSFNLSILIILFDVVSSCGKKNEGCVGTFKGGKECFCCTCTKKRSVFFSEIWECFGFDKFREEGGR